MDRRGPAAAAGRVRTTGRVPAIPCALPAAARADRAEQHPAARRRILPVALAARAAAARSGTAALPDGLRPGRAQLPGAGGTRTYDRPRGTLLK